MIVRKKWVNYNKIVKKEQIGWKKKIAGYFYSKNTTSFAIYVVIKTFFHIGLRDFLLVIVEKKQLFVLFFRKTVDIPTKGDYYYTIVILHVHFARVAKGVGEFLGNLTIL